MQPDEIDLMINYFHSADRALLLTMGVYAPKLPEPTAWRRRLQEDFDRPLTERVFYYTIWVLDGQPVGHCNVNRVRYGEQASMHLHLWAQPQRRQGLGSQFVVGSITQFFQKLALRRLFCEPYALNPAPNKTLARVGFRYLYTHETTPGPFNFHQPVKRWLYEHNGSI